MDWLQYPASVLGILGAWLVARKNRWGFMAWIIGNILWIIFGVAKNQWGVFVQFIVFWFLAVYGWVNWSKEELKEGESDG